MLFDGRVINSDALNFWKLTWQRVDTVDFFAMSIWSALELSSGVVVACLPATRRVVVAYLPMVSTAVSQYASRLSSRRAPGEGAYRLEKSNTRGSQANLAARTGDDSGFDIELTRTRDIDYPGILGDGTALSKGHATISALEDEEQDDANGAGQGSHDDTSVLTSPAPLMAAPTCPADAHTRSKRRSSGIV